MNGLSLAYRCQAVFLILGDDFPLSGLSLPTRMRNALVWHSAETLGDIRTLERGKLPYDILLGMREIGKKTVEDFVAWQERYIMQEIIQ